jgi:saccharopine dehydrogenase (NADP+, L-glutamate forming)
MNMKKVIFLGAGLVSRPGIRYLLQCDEIDLHVADLDKSKAVDIIGKHFRGNAHALDVSQPNQLHELIADASVVVSMLPYTFHTQIAELCLEHNVHLVTASYVSDGMLALDEAARAKKLLFLNELGADPGIDHMSAMQIIHQLEKDNAEILSFESDCGGLPAPESNNNPVGYKISWSPRGIVMAGRNGAKFLKNGEIVTVQQGELFHHHWQQKINGLGEMEVYPNRNSLIYRSLYGLDKAHTVIRGTIRYPGWSNLMLALQKLGYLDDSENPELRRLTIRRVTGMLLKASPAQDFIRKCAEFLNIPLDSQLINQLRWLGLFDDIPLSDLSYGSPLDVIAKLMTLKMQYLPGEQDMLVMQHRLLAQYPDGQKEEIRSTLLDYGQPGGDTSMSRTVSLPAAIGARFIANNQIQLTGVHIPIQPEIYQPVLKELARFGIKLQETKKTL